MRGVEGRTGSKDQSRLINRQIKDEGQTKSGSDVDDEGHTKMHNIMEDYGQGKHISVSVMWMTKVTQKCIILWKTMFRGKHIFVTNGTTWTWLWMREMEARGLPRHHRGKQAEQAGPETLPHGHPGEAGDQRETWQCSLREEPEPQVDMEEAS